MESILKRPGPRNLCWNLNRVISMILDDDDGGGGTEKYIHLTITKGSIFNSNII
jgi:hypothetical protein